MAKTILQEIATYNASKFNNTETLNKIFDQDTKIDDIKTYVKEKLIDNLNDYELVVYDIKKQVFDKVELLNISVKTNQLELEASTDLLLDELASNYKVIGTVKKNYQRSDQKLSNRVDLMDLQKLEYFTGPIQSHSTDADTLEITRGVPNPTSERSWIWISGKKINYANHNIINISESGTELIIGDDQYKTTYLPHDLKIAENAKIVKGNLKITTGELAVVPTDATDAEAAVILAANAVTSAAATSISSNGAIKSTASYLYGYSGVQVNNTGFKCSGKGNITLAEGNVELEKGNVDLTEGDITLTKGDIKLTDGRITQTGKDTNKTNTMQSLTLTGDLKVLPTSSEERGKLTVAKATTLSDTLKVTGATTLSDTLKVAGATTLNDTLTVAKAATLSDKLTVTGVTALGDKLTVTGATTLSGLTVDTSAAFSCNVTASGHTITADVFDGVATSARYADLAEIYTSDKLYEPGTVLSIGTEFEATLFNGRPLLGVVSTNPGYLLNSEEQGVEIALTGRVPVKTMFNIKRGDYIIPDLDNPGYCRGISQPPKINLIGIAISDSFDNRVEVKV